MVRVLYSVVNRERIRENFTSLNRVMIRRLSVESYLGHRKFSVQINVSLKTGTVRKWGKLVFLGSSYPSVERGGLQS